jgi:very-short-patch-repair endonuclease
MLIQYIIQNSMNFQIIKNKTLNCELQYIKVDDETWYIGRDVCNFLGYTDTDGAIRKHVDKEDKMKLGDLVEVLDFATLTGNERRKIMINQSGMKSLICRSRKPNASVLAKQFDIEVNNHRYECKESESIGAIMKAFDGEKMRAEYSVKGYRVDLYFPDYNLCVECDENNHSDRDADDEIIRQKRITKRLKCQWLRFDPDSDDFNIYKVINQIFIIIKSKL